jgi:hypothetical protein
LVGFLKIKTVLDYEKPARTAQLDSQERLLIDREVQLLSGKKVNYVVNVSEDHLVTSLDHQKRNHGSTGRRGASLRF